MQHRVAVQFWSTIHNINLAWLSERNVTPHEGPTTSQWAPVACGWRGWRNWRNPFRQFWYTSCMCWWTLKILKDLDFLHLSSLPTDLSLQFRCAQFARNLLQRLRDLLHIGQAGKEQSLAGNPTNGTTGTSRREQEPQDLMHLDAIPHLFFLCRLCRPNVCFKGSLHVSPTSSSMCRSWNTPALLLQAFIVISSSWRREWEAVEDSRDGLRMCAWARWGLGVCVCTCLFGEPRLSIASGSGPEQIWIYLNIIRGFNILYCFSCNMMQHAWKRHYPAKLCTQFNSVKQWIKHDKAVGGLRLCTWCNVEQIWTGMTQPKAEVSKVQLIAYNLHQLTTFINTLQIPAAHYNFTTLIWIMMINKQFLHCLHSHFYAM